MEATQLEQANLVSAFSPNPRRAKSRFVWGALICGVASLFIPKAHAQTLSDSAFFYPSKTKKQMLHSAQNWVAVQVEPGASLAATATSLSAGQGVTSTLAIAKQNLVLFKVGSTNAAQARTSLSARALKSATVLRTVRAFENGASPIIETKEFLVRFAPGVTQDRASEIVATVDGVLVRPLGSYSPNAYLVRLKDAAGTASIEAANALNARDDVQYSMPNLIYPMQKRSVATRSSGVKPRATFDDPLIGRQWHLQNTGQNSGTAGADVKAFDAWNITVGSGITICINDDGVEASHPDLQANLLSGYGAVTSDSDPNPGTGDLHGTSCAGVAAGVGNNGIGISGVAPSAKILPIRVLTNSTTLEDEARSFKYAADNGADVISDSWGPDDGNPYTDHQAEAAPLPAVVKDGIDYAVTKGRNGKGCVVLFAAGNGSESMDVDGYSSYDQVIAVGASNNKDQRSLYSDYGQSLDICAPSGRLPSPRNDGQTDTGTLNITTTDRVGGLGYGGIAGQPNYTNDFNGTSSACPLAAGVAALVLSVNPDLTYTQVRTILENTADKIDTTNGQYDSSGHSIYYGYGRINALKAVQAAQAAAIQSVALSGKVITTSGKGISGITVAARTGSVTGTIVTSIATDSNGAYSLSVPKNTTYYVTPVRGSAKIAFSPRSQTVQVASTVVTGVNFVVKNVPVVTLTNPLPNATVTGSTTVTATTTNDEDVKDVVFSYHAADSSYTGNSATINDAVGTTAGVTTVPLTVTTTNSTDVLGTVTGTYTITHQERSNLVITLIDPSGNRYTLYNRATTGSGTLSNSFSLTPTGVNPNGVWNLEILDAVQSNTGTLTGWKLNILPQRTTIGTVTAATNGVWSATWDTAKVEPGTYSVEALAEAYSVDSTDINTGIKVVSSLKSISGTITLNGSGLQGVTVTATQGTTTVKSATTNASGVYTITTLANGTYTITPTLSGYSFSPLTATVTINGSNVTGVNFTAKAGSPTPTPSPDTTAPLVTVSSPASNSVNAAMTSIFGTASDVGTYVARVRARLDLVSKMGVVTPVIAERSTSLSAINGGVQWTLSTGTLAEGRYRVIATAQDAAGNTASTQRFFFVDTNVPTVAISTPSAGSSQSGAFTAIGTAADVGSYVRSVRIKLSQLSNGQPVRYYTGSSTLSQTYDPNRDQFGTLTDEGEGVRWTLGIAALPAGSYRMEATATDASGRTVTSTVNFTIK